MMSVRYIIKMIVKKIKGNVKCAVEAGMVVEEGVSVMGGG